MAIANLPRRGYLKGWIHFVLSRRETAPVGRPLDRRRLHDPGSWP